jgi:hypothetical protein
VTPMELAAIAARWSEYGGMGNPHSADDYTDAGCRIFAEHGFRDVPALLAVLRERDNTIARVRAWVEKEHPRAFGAWDSGYDCATAEALDPQETE